MRRRTALALVSVFAALVAVAVVGLGVSSGGGLTEQWVSDTPRENQVNHHAVGVDSRGEVVVAPVTEVPNRDVTLTNTSCSLVRLAPDTGSSVWQTGLSPDECTSHAVTEPAIGDVDRDGEREVVVASTENAVIAYAASNGSEEWRTPLSTYGYGRPTVANVTPTPGPEVVASDIRGGIVVAHGNGSVAWRFDLNATGWSRPYVYLAPTVGDIDDDSSPEILVESRKGVALLSGNGTVEWRHDGSAMYAATARVGTEPAMRVFAAGPSSVHALEGRTGESAWEREFTNARIRAAADADRDGTVELFVGQRGGNVLALDARSGETEWSTPVSEGNDTGVTSPVLGDVDGDDRPEVVGVLNTGTVAVLDPETGGELASYERNVPVWTFPTVHDIDGDENAEILVRYGDGRVVALAYSST